MKYRIPDARATVLGDRIQVLALGQHHAKIKALPQARREKGLNTWSFPASVTCALALASAFAEGTLQVDDTFTALCAQAVVAEQAQEAKVATDLPEIPVSRTKAWLHQRQAFWFVARLWGKQRPEDFR